MRPVNSDETPGRDERGAGGPGEPAERGQRPGARPPEDGGSRGDRPPKGAEEPPGAGRRPPESPRPPEPPSGPSGDRGDHPGQSGRDGATGPVSGRRRLVDALWPPRLTRAQLTVAVLLFVLGLGLAIQVRSTNENSVLRGARQEDLVRILDELDNRTQRLEDEKRRLEGQRTELENSSDQAEEARRQTLQKERQLGILAGTVAAQGPGIEVTIHDSRGAVRADMLLDAIQELRAAGAEAIQVNDVRVVADTYFTDADDGVRIDGRKVTQPFVFKVIGKPEDLEPALNIPGGVVQTLKKEQATVDIQRSEKIVVDALRPMERPDYARSSPR